MRQQDRFKFFGIGLLAGILFIILIFGKKSSCKDYVNNYLPNGRVLAELRFRDKKYTNQAMIDMKNIGIDTIFVNQKILHTGKINFDSSHPRKEPCGEFTLDYKDSISLRLKIKKCPDGVIIESIKNLKDSN